MGIDRHLEISRFAEASGKSMNEVILKAIDEVIKKVSWLYWRNIKINSTKDNSFGRIAHQVSVF